MELPHLEVLGVACHIGSQITRVAPFVEALERLKDLVGRLRVQGIGIRYLDLGGGLGIRYDREEPPHPHEYGGKLVERLKGLDVTLILEPGRVLVGNAGILVTKVLYTKESEARHFIIVDAGMNDLVRPSLYGSFHAVCPVVQGSRPWRPPPWWLAHLRVRGFPGQGPGAAGPGRGSCGGALGRAPMGLSWPATTTAVDGLGGPGIRGATSRVTRAARAWDDLPSGRLRAAGNAVTAGPERAA